MTAADDVLRAALAEALAAFHGYDADDVLRYTTWTEQAAALLPTVRAAMDRRSAEAIRDFADLIDRGPTFPMPPSIFSAMARERADDLAPDQP